MSETVKVVIEIPKDAYEATKGDVFFHDIAFDIWVATKHGTPLDDVKNKILDYNVRQHVSGSESFLRGYAVGMDKSAEILDSIGKESEE